MNKLGVSSIELRHRHKDLNTGYMRKAIEAVAVSGMTVTIRGDSLPFPEVFSFEKLFP